MNNGRELVLSWLSAYFREPPLCAVRPLPPVCGSVAAPNGNFRQRVWFAIYTKLGKASEYKFEGYNEKVLSLDAVCDSSGQLNKRSFVTVLVLHMRSNVAEPYYL